MTPPPLVLDTDASVGPLPGEIRIPLSDDWREAVRFGCSQSTLQARMDGLEPLMPSFSGHGTVFMGSGDFHHLSLPLILRCLHTQRQPVEIVVLDNHPDNMRFPWGVHCGSWVRHVALLPEVAHMHVIGITSNDLSLGHAWEHQLAALRAGKLTYWSCGVNTRWARYLGLGERFRSFSHTDALITAAAGQLAQSCHPVYLSIDKDVFAPDVVRTNWDQGQMREAHLEQLLPALRGRLVGSDVTGDVSTWQYRSAWKRWLSAADGQKTEREEAELPRWQARQHAFNLQLLDWLAALR
ncbi:hypothetical protein [Comamonas sp. GB3 AK4-5]|uniref:hypothetical protein n=1 Tax=Comamonas sp. GB3 AK4-5 TaxID=3231487 RepID=UPI00351EE1B3